MLRREEGLKVKSLVHSTPCKEILAVYSGRQVPSISIDGGYGNVLGPSVAVKLAYRFT